MNHGEYLRERIKENTLKHDAVAKQGNEALDNDRPKFARVYISKGIKLAGIIQELELALANYESKPANIDTSVHEMD